MFPTLKAGDFIIYKPIKKSQLKINKGSIIVARNPHNQEDLIIKRVTNKNSLEVELLGDNSHFSTDSRHFGPIKLDQLIGLVEQIIPKSDL
tara:strand:- start:103 stop:375 length:273 start_codon:yes stop_codon:yes gene_type:complete